MCNIVSSIKNFVDRKIARLKREVLEHSILNLVIFTIGGVGVAFLYAHYSVKKADDLGQIGSYLGGTIGTLFLFLTVVTMIHTLYEQGKELKAARALQQKQTEIISRQQFESTFFSLLNRHNVLSDNLLKEGTFSKTQDLLFKRNMDSSDDDKDENKLKEILVKDNNESIGPYFRFLYQILKFIDNSDLLNDDKSIETDESKDPKKFFSNLLRASIDTKALQLRVCKSNCVKLVCTS